MQCIRCNWTHLQYKGVHRCNFSFENARNICNTHAMRVFLGPILGHFSRRFQKCNGHPLIPHQSFCTAHFQSLFCTMPTLATHISCNSCRIQEFLGPILGHFLRSFHRYEARPLIHREANVGFGLHRVHHSYKGVHRCSSPFGNARKILKFSNSQALLLNSQILIDQCSVGQATELFGLYNEHSKSF